MVSSIGNNIVRRPGEKKSTEKRENETLEELIHNIGKAIRLDTGGTKNWIQFQKDMKRHHGIEIKDESAQIIIDWFRTKLNRVQVAVRERTDIIAKRYGEAHLPVDSF